MLFNGFHEHVLDEKHRVQLPAEFRDEMRKEKDGEAVYLGPGRGNTLSLFPERFFQTRFERLRTQSLDFDEGFYPLHVRLPVDKQGRILIPDVHLSLVALTTFPTEVVVAGANCRMVIWPKADFYAEFRRRREQGGMDAALERLLYSDAGPVADTAK